MAQLGEASTKVHITWDSEPTDEAKAFIRKEVLVALKEAFEESSWFAELVGQYVHTALERDRKELVIATQKELGPALGGMVYQKKEGWEGYGGHHL
jgi:hypothetical protein